MVFHLQVIYLKAKLSTLKFIKCRTMFSIYIDKTLVWTTNQLLFHNKQNKNNFMSVKRIILKSQMTFENITNASDISLPLSQSVNQNNVNSANPGLHPPIFLVIKLKILKNNNKQKLTQQSAILHWLKSSCSSNFVFINRNRTSHVDT